MKPVLILLALTSFAVAVFLAAALVGTVDVPLSAFWGQTDNPIQMTVFWRMRLPRVLMGLLAGCGLASSGLVFQAMFRNPLATPFTLGVSSGASLGAALCMFLGQLAAKGTGEGTSAHLWIVQMWASGERIFTALGISPVAVCAFLGALTAILLVYGLTHLRQGFSTASMLLAGVAVSFFFSSLILVLQYVSDPTETFHILRWTMGGLSVVDRDDLLSVLPFVGAGCLIIVYLTHELNLITTGEQLAASRGMEVQRTKRALFFAASLMVGAVVSICGPIGFVGLMAPHICRLLIGPDHRYLTPATMLFGGAFLVLCDAVARVVMAPTELPVGIVTALLGGPFFLWLLLGKRVNLD